MTLDEFLKELDIDLTDWQKEMLYKMWSDRDKIQHPFLPRGHGYSLVRLYYCALAHILTDIQRVQNIEQIHKEIMSGDSIKPDRYLPQIYVIDESPEILEKLKKENLWRKTNPMITTKRLGKVDCDGRR